jgi:hypothetical protein
MPKIYASRSRISEIAEDGRLGPELASGLKYWFTLRSESFQEFD